MKKNTPKKLSNRLVKYSALSLALAGIADVSGQIIFTDVDPDFEGGTGDSFAIDFDGNGTDDLTIAQTSPFLRANGDVIGLINNGYYYATNLSEGVLVDSNQDFLDYGDLCYSSGYDNSFCVSGTQPDGFIGVRFDVSGITYFGWVELKSVTFETFSVLGYAFEATPDQGIAVGATLALEDVTINGLTAYVADKALIINAQSPLENVTIYNLNGQVVVSQKLANTSENIDLGGLSTGVYIATVQTEGKLKAIKFVK